METLDALRQLHRDTTADVYIVGGFVRDLLRRKGNDDLDIVVCNLPIQRVRKYLDNLGTFKKVTIAKTNDVFDVNIYLFRTYDDTTTAQLALPRKGVKQLAHHKNTLKQDAKHRDFTINAMYLPVDYKSRADIIDTSHGKLGIKSRTIVANGNPYARIKESPIRMLRAISLAARTGYRLHKDLKKAISERVGLLTSCPADAIRKEVNKILLSKKPSRYIRLMYKLGILKVVMPELNACYGVPQNKRYHMHDVFGHCLCACDNIDPDLVLRLTALFHDLGKPAARAVADDGRATFYKHEIGSTRLAYTLMTRLGYETKIKNEVSKLIRLHMYHYTSEFTDAAVRRLISRIGVTSKDLQNIGEFPLFKLRIADRMGKGYGVIQITKRQLDFEARLVRLFKESKAYSIKDLKINGRDLMSVFRLDPGPLVGEILESLLDKVLENPSVNERSQLLKLAIDCINADE